MPRLSENIAFRQPLLHAEAVYQVTGAGLNTERALCKPQRSDHGTFLPLATSNM